MVEPTGHCPYLGLKQNQAIRFASPTPEHRCYAAGQAQEIPLIQPDYQAAFCLSPSHIKCPLYTGSGLPSTVGIAPEPRSEASLAAAGGLGGWLAGLPLRDRMIYMTLLALLGVILVIYAAVGLTMAFGNGAFPGFPFGGTTVSPSATLAPVSPEPTVAPPTASPTEEPTASLLPTTQPRVTPTSGATSFATATVTEAATPSPTNLPTIEVAPTLPLPPPTLRPTLPPPPPTNTPSDLVPLPSDTPAPTLEPSSTSAPTTEPPTAEPPTAEPPTAEPPTAEPPTAEPPTAETFQPSLEALPAPPLVRTIGPAPAPTVEAFPGTLATPQF